MSFPPFRSLLCLLLLSVPTLASAEQGQPETTPPANGVNGRPHPIPPFPPVLGDHSLPQPGDVQ